VTEHERLFTKEYNTLLSAPCSEPAPLRACDKPTPPRPAPHAMRGRR